MQPTTDITLRNFVQSVCDPYAQVRVMQFAIGICIDEYLDLLVDARNELIEALFKRLQIGTKPVNPLERHAECRTQ